MDAHGNKDNDYKSTREMLNMSKGQAKKMISKSKKRETSMKLNNFDANPIQFTLEAAGQKPLYGTEEERKHDGDQDKRIEFLTNAHKKRSDSPG